MGRKALPVVVADQPDLDSAALEQGVTTLNEIASNAAQVAAMMDYDLPYNRERVVQEACFYMAQSAEAMLEAGKRLILLKENEDHGTFSAIVEEKMGIQPRVARKMMQAAVKYLSNPALAAKTPKLSLLGKSKLYEMMVMDDDDLIQLSEGGSVAGLALDDIDRMSIRELKTALRESRDVNAATERVLATKNKKIDQLSATLERRKNEAPIVEWEWATYRRTLLDICERIAASAQTELRRALNAIQEYAQEAGELPSDIDALQSQAMSSVMQTLVILQNDFHLAVDLESIVTPPWMAEKPSTKPEIFSND